MRHLIPYLVTGLLVLFASCRDKEGLPNEHSEQQLRFAINYEVADDEFNFDSTYTFQNNVAVKFNTFRYYLSNISLKDVNGNALLLSEQHLAKPDKRSTTYINFNNIEPNTYTALSFNVGIDAFTNSTTDPEDGTLSTDNPLAIQTDVPMWWNRTQGYKFLVLEGLYDADAVPDGIPDTPFKYQIGTDQFLQGVNIPLSVIVEPNIDVIVMIEVDVSAILNGVDLRSENYTQSFDAPNVARMVADEIPGAFSVSSY